MRAIRVVKLNNWETFFETKINEIRSKELKYLRLRKYLDAICVYLWASAPILITIAILITYTLILKEELTAAKVYKYKFINVNKFFTGIYKFGFSEHFDFAIKCFSLGFKFNC